MSQPQRIRDPLHNLIEFKGDEFEGALWGVIQTQPFQRLRRIKQLGFSDLVYPGATHSRFAHSLGVFHTARLLMQVIETHLGRDDYKPNLAQRALAAALVHDLGHGPFSHAFEDVGRRLNIKMAHHEDVSDALIRNGEVATALNVLGSGFADDVANIIKSKGPRNIYSAVVSSQFDADRLDYMQRDRLMSGTQHGMIDFKWLIANLKVGKVATGVDEKSTGEIETFVLGQKAVYAAEAYVLGLFQLYPTVYFHKTTRCAEKIFTELLCRTILMIRDGSVAKTGLSENHPIAKFARESERLENVLKLDDTVMWGALPMLAEAEDVTIASLSERLRSRNLYKSLDVRDRILSHVESDDEKKRAAIVEQAAILIRQKITAWRHDYEETMPRILSDEAERSPYKEFDGSKGPLNQIRILSSGDKHIDLGERSKIVRAIDPFRFYRLYVEKDDTQARNFITQAIEAETRNAATIIS